MYDSVIVTKEIAVAIRVEPFLCDVTERFPRTVQEAIGPHASSHITEPVEKTPAYQWAIYITCVIAAVVLVWRIPQGV